MKKTPFIAIEGPIGVGKTSLALAIADQLDYNLLKEIVHEHPFLDKFYDDIETWAFQTEMFFLVNRHVQLEEIQTNYLRHQKPVVSDYHIFKNLIFAEMNLDEKKFDKFSQIYNILLEDTPPPNVLIVLNASLETLLKRIALRNREFEQDIDPTYLLRLIEAYDAKIDIFKSLYPHIPIIKINGDDFDFVHHPEDLTRIMQLIQPFLIEEHTHEKI
ncbi:MAG: deoxynucleoside kinase [Culicoidibacterales bacterium]